MEHTELSETGSINDIKKRLLLWAKRSPKGLARVEFSSEFSRQKVLEEMRTTLAEAEIKLHEIVLPSQQKATVVVEKLLEELNQIDSGLVSITGFSTAFTNQVPLEESIRILNFHRDRLVSSNLNQIWWMTPAFLQTSIHAMPDVNSWFSLRLQLKEMILNELDPSLYLPVNSDGTYSNIDDARRRVHNLLQRFQQAKLAGQIPDLELLITYLLPALDVLAEVDAQKEFQDLTLQFEGLLGQLKLTSSPELARSLDHLASLYKDQGRYNDAEPLYLRALEIRKSQFGEAHPSFAASINNLAELYRLQARYPEAEQLYLQALAIWEKLGTDNLDIAPALNNLGLLYTDQGRYAESKKLFLRELDIMKTKGSGHLDIANCLHNLGFLYKLEGADSQAETLYLQSLKLTEQQLGTDHSSIASILNNLAGVYYSQGRYSEAESTYLRSLHIMEKQLGRDHPNVAALLNNLSALYDLQKRYSDAEPLYLRSLSILEQKLGSEHPSVANSLNNLGVLYANMRQFTKAESLLIKSLNLRKKVLGEEHPNTIRTKKSLANVQANMK